MIDEQYVKTGQVRIVSKNLPVHGAEASEAAEAALCASDQGKYWEYHDALLENLYVGKRVTANADSLKKLAADLGLSQAAFGACLDQNKYAQRVQEEAAEAQKKGITGTPTFFINDSMLVGAQPFATFKTAIDNALQGK
jgi:protein-disulfide isomerase